MPDIQLLAARVSTKGSCFEDVANPSGENAGLIMPPTMGLYVEGDHFTHFVALGKVYDRASTICNVPYANDVVKVSVVEVYNGDAQVLLLMSEI